MSVWFKFFLVSIFSMVTCQARLDPQFYSTIYSFRKCFGSGHPLLCVKEAALDVINETLTNDRPLIFYDMVEIGRNPKYEINNSIEEALPKDLMARSMKLNEILYGKIEDYFKSRTIKFNMAPAIEEENVEQEGKYLKDGYYAEYSDTYNHGPPAPIYYVESTGGGKKKCRKKGGGGGGGGGGGKKGGMMMMGMIGMACMVGQMMMGKIAFLAGAALIIAKIALLMSAMMGMKKMGGGGGGGGETHVVWASPGGSDGGHSHGGGGGGWHRSMGDEMAYKGYQDNTFPGYKKK